MEICFENNTAAVRREIYRQTKRVQESAESVVPDTDDDIGKVLSVHSALSLKSKDVTGRGVCVSGEAVATVLYITESREGIAFVRVRRDFTIDYDVADISPDTTAQINLRIMTSEARAVNPRKISVAFDIAGELTCFRQEEVCIEARPETGADCALYSRLETADVVFADSAMEKTFAVSEQFSFPAGKPVPARLVSERIEYDITDNQLVGTKLISKGEVRLRVCYLSDEVCYPVMTEFKTTFSQIMDIGTECMDICSAHAETTSAYFSLTETMNGDKMLDAEVHAVLQTVCRSRHKISYVSDAYCNSLPTQCETEKKQFPMISGVQKIKLSGDERIEITEDCADVLCVFAEVSGAAQDKTQLKATAALDILYKAEGGELSSVHRSMELEGECGESAVRIAEVSVSDMLLRPDGAYLNAHITAEVTAQTTALVEIERVNKVNLNDEAPYDTAAYPSVSLVKAEGESLWALAKKYHSDVDTINAVNDTSSDIRGCFLLIPKVI